MSFNVEIAVKKDVSAFENLGKADIEMVEVERTRDDKENEKDNEGIVEVSGRPGLRSSSFKKR